MPWISSVGRAHSRSKIGTSSSPASAVDPISFSRYSSASNGSRFHAPTSAAPGFSHAIVESGNANVPVAIFQRRDNLRRRLDGVGSRAAVVARMQIGPRALHVNFAVHDAAQPVVSVGSPARTSPYRRLPPRPQRAPTDALDVFLDVFAVGFFFALDQKSNIQGAGRFAQTGAALASE